MAKIDRFYGGNALFTISSWNLSGLKAATGTTFEEITWALRQAKTATAGWANTAAAKELSRHLKLPYSVLRRRVKVKRRIFASGSEHDTATVWFGVNAVDLKYLKPVQTPTGVTTSVKTVDGGFINPGIRGHVFKRRGVARLPIDKQSYDVQAQADEYIEREFLPRLQQFYLTSLEDYLSRVSGKPTSVFSKFLVQRSRLNN